MTQEQKNKTDESRTTKYAPMAPSRRSELRTTGTETIEVILLTHDELEEIIADVIKSTVRIAIMSTLENLGIRPSKDKVWMSQSEAHRMVGRRRLEKAMREGKVRWEKPDMDKKTGRVSVMAADVIKLLKEPK